MDVHVFDFNESVRGVAMAPSPVTMARVTERKVLTSADAEKKTLELTLSWEGVSCSSSKCGCTCVYIVCTSLHLNKAIIHVLCFTELTVHNMYFDVSLFVSL